MQLEVSLELAIVLVAAAAIFVALAWRNGSKRYKQMSEELRQAQAEMVELTQKLDAVEQELTEARVGEAKNSADGARAAKLEGDLNDARKRIEELLMDAVAARSVSERVPDLEASIESLKKEVLGLTEEKATIEARLQEQSAAHAEKVQALVDVRAEIDKNMKVLASETLQASQASFLKLANETFQKHKEGATADLEARQKAVEALVNPVREALKACHTSLDAMEKARGEAFGSISAELRHVAEMQAAVRGETSKLVNALRAAPKTRGRWGEHTLRNVLELAGLSAHVDFLTEQSFERDGAKARPDAIIRLPGGRHLVVDAKTSLTGYLDAFEAADEAERDQHLMLHAGHLRAHVKQLSGKAYWDGLTVTPDFVVMFVPGDNFYAAAAERDPSLFEEAVQQRVLIVTPATLIALAKAVAFGWRQEKVAENARKVHELGRDLYKRLTTMGDHIMGLGTSLTSTVKKYNQFVGSLEGSVMPQARRFSELEIEGAQQPLEAIDEVREETRLLRSDKDFAPSVA